MVPSALQNLVTVFRRTNGAPEQDAALLPAKESAVLPASGQLENGFNGAIQVLIHFFFLLR